ncbi:uncharacterized protein LOC110267484 isoform X2 [Arachis ipaensis]|uniref:uncharacterized protein LOC110267484 isoform X2 n=1 Tax=Arachis ipaensis TaxID=130454 RepID=UPI000A2B4C9C|nr:uncharacterized protein LOC110267484 isoform X2 [Arachis ipaensis]
MELAGTIPRFCRSFRSCSILVNAVVIILATSAVAGKTLPSKTAAESSVLVSSNLASASLSVKFSITMRVVAKAGCARSLSRVVVVLVTGCGVGVVGTATGAAVTWFPRRKWLGAEVAVVGDFGLR